MAGLLSNFRNTFIVGTLLAIVFIAGYAAHHGEADAIF